MSGQSLVTKDGIEVALDYALNNKVTVDLRTRSGYMFEGVTITGKEDRAVEVRALVHRGAGGSDKPRRSARLFVVSIDSIEWVSKS